MYSNSGLAQEDCRFMSEQIYLCIIVKATHLLSVIICDLTNPDPSIIHFSSVSGTVNGLTNSSVIEKGSPKVLHYNYELASIYVHTYCGILKSTWKLALDLRLSKRLGCFSQPHLFGLLDRSISSTLKFNVIGQEWLIFIWRKSEFDFNYKTRKELK